MLSQQEQILRETLLGALRSRDEDGDQKIHSSDFQRALDQVGVSFGSAMVDQVMVMCRIDDNGFVDFSQFAEDCQKTRRDVEREAGSHPAAARATSAGAPLQAYAASSVQQQQAAADRQAELLRNHAEKIHQIFDDYDRGEYLLSLHMIDMIYICNDDGSWLSEKKIALKLIHHTQQ
jgi:hypothetical protein